MVAASWHDTLPFWCGANPSVLVRTIQQSVNTKYPAVGNNLTASERLIAVRDKLNLSQTELAQRLRVGRSYVSKLISSQREPSEKVLKMLRVLEMGDLYGTNDHSGNRDLPNTGARYIAHIAWTEAAALEDFESLPPLSPRQILSDCPDAEAFAVTLGADCMEDEFVVGDILTVMPLADLRTGCLALANLRHGGLVFRRWTPNDPRSAQFRLTAAKPPYRPIDLIWDDVRWIYPVYRVLKIVW